MTARHQISRAALELIKRFEGFRRRAARLSDGRWTIGYGHTLTAREGAEVSPEDAEALLIYDLRPIAAAVNELTYSPLTQNQFDALVAFTFNVGVDNFRRSAVLRRVNEGSMIQAAGALEMWRKADFEGERIVVDALVRRRAAEKTLFLTPLGGWIPAPSPILRPRVDYDVSGVLPRDSTELETSLVGDVAEAHRTPVAPPEEAPASIAVADALTARLNQILPETAQTPVEADTVAPAVQVEPEAREEPPAIFAPEAAAPHQPTIVIPVVEPQPVEPQPAPPTAYVAEAGPSPSFMAAPGLFGVLFGKQQEEEAPQAYDPDVTRAAEPVAAPLVAPPSIVPDAGQSVVEVPPPEPEGLRDPRFDIPEREAMDPMDLSRRVVWREAPMETDANRLLGGGVKGVSPIVLAGVFLVGLAVFAGGIVWGMSTKGSGVISWVLGLVGIVCVVSAVYIYLERLGEREE